MFTNFHLTVGACKARGQLKNGRKLRMLCLHGWNTDIEVMQY
jgi:hypothetical protein